MVGMLAMDDVGSFFWGNKQFKLFQTIQPSSNRWCSPPIFWWISRIGGARILPQSRRSYFSSLQKNCWVYCRSDLFVLYGSLWKLFLAGAHHLLILLILADSTVWLKSTTFRISWPLGREVLKRTEPNFSSCLSLMRRSPTPLKM